MSKNRIIWRPMTELPPRNDWYLVTVSSLSRLPHSIFGDRYTTEYEFNDYKGGWIKDDEDPHNSKMIRWAEMPAPYRDDLISDSPVSRGPLIELQIDDAVHKSRDDTSGQ